MTATATEVSADTEYVDAITEDSTKAEIFAHLREFHFIPYNINSKSLKGQLLSLHRRQHDMADMRGARNIKRAHVHLPEPGGSGTGENPFDKLNSEANRLNIAPGSLTGLSASDRTALQKIIKSDYDTLLEQVAQAATAFRAQRRNEIEAEWEAKTKGRTQAQAKLSTAVNKAQAQLNSVMDELAEKGFVGRYDRRIQINTPELFIQGRDEALGKAVTEANEAERRARSIITMRRNAALRAILLATVSAEAVEVAASTVPAIEDVMAEARRQATLAITAGE